MNKKNLPIALFDSGVGGLTVFRAIRDLLPHESLLYLGDTARVPYGTKSGDTIIRYTLNAAGKLAAYGVKMLVIACNTATSAALPLLREKFFPIPALGVIEPGAEEASKASRNGRIAVIGTEATIRGGAYQEAIRRRNPNARIVTRACTLFVALAEEGWADGPIAEAVARRYLGDIFPDNAPQDSLPDALLLGCTHFPLFQNVLAKIAGPHVTIVDSARATARAVARELERLDLLAVENSGQHLLTTDNPERFMEVGGLFLGRNLALEEIELVDL